MLIDIIPDYLTISVNDKHWTDPPTYTLLSYPLYRDETCLSKRDLISYAALLNELMSVQYTIVTEFKVTGGGVKCSITEEDFIVMKLNTLDLADCCEYLIDAIEDQRTDFD